MCSVCLFCPGWSGCNEMTIGDSCDCSGNVMNGHGIYVLDGFLMNMMKTWMRTRPTPSMKHGWLYRNFQWQIIIFNYRQNEVFGSSYDDDLTRYVDDSGERDNTFLVKRECCCICKFEIYSDVYYHCMSSYPHRTCVFLISGCHSCTWSLRYNLYCTSWK